MYLFRFPMQVYDLLAPAFPDPYQFLHERSSSR